MSNLNYSSIDHFELSYVDIPFISDLVDTAIYDLKKNMYFFCLAYEYKEGYPTLCGQYLNSIEWIPWEENRFLYIKEKVSSK